MSNNSTNKSIGLTKDVGYQIGVRRTLPLSLDEAWTWLTTTAVRGKIGAPITKTHWPN